MIDTVVLHYSESGQGTPVILLHGFPFCGGIWHKQQERLSDLYRIIAPDLRGHGQSPAPAGVYDMQTLARDVLALLDSLQIEKAVLLGHSMGGYVALAAWKLAPARFLALGLIDSQAAPDTEEARSGRVKMAEKVAKEGSQAVATAMLPRLFAPALSTGDPIVEQVRQMILKTPGAAIISSLNGMAARPDSSAMLRTINVPMLILTGDKDQIIATATAEAMAARLPKATLAVIENAGHMPMLERPEATTTAIRKFLSDVGE